MKELKMKNSSTTAFRCESPHWFSPPMSVETKVARIRYAHHRQAGIAATDQEHSPKHRVTMRCCTHNKQAGNPLHCITLRCCTHNKQAGTPLYSQFLECEGLEITHQCQRLGTTSNRGKCRCCFVNIDPARLLIRPPSTHTHLGHFAVP